MRWPLVSLRRYTEDTGALRAEADRLRIARDAALKERDSWKATATTTAGQYTDAGVVNDCLTRRVEQLQAQLDDALGLNHPAVVAGQHWQDRRVDKPHPAKETS